MFLRVPLLCATVSIFSSYILALSFPLKRHPIDDWQTTGSEKVYNEGLKEYRITFEISFWWNTLIAQLHTELLTIADGYHIQFPLSEKNETDQQHKTISIAVSKLLMNLKTMERARKVAWNISSELNFQSFRSDFGKIPSEIILIRKPSETAMRNLLQDFFRVLNYQMNTDEELGDEYKKRINEAWEIVKRDPEMCEPVIKMWEESLYPTDFNFTRAMKFWDDKKTYRRSRLHDLFLSYSSEFSVGWWNREWIKRHFLASALFQKAAASPSSESKVNDIYQQALIEADNGYNGSILGLGVQGNGDSLFNSLEKALKLDPVLYEEVESLREQIEKSFYRPVFTA